MDTSHLIALLDGLDRERERLASATNPHEIAIRTMWVFQREKEVDAEKAFLGMNGDASGQPLSDDELLQLLGS